MLVAIELKLVGLHSFALCLWFVEQLNSGSVTLNLVLLGFHNDFGVAFE